MSTITKEWLESQISAIKAVGITDSNTLQAFEIALASLEAEPVAWLLSGGGAKNHVSFDSGNAYADPLREVTPLYTSPPAPVSVPAAMEMDDDFDSAFEHGKAVGWNAYRAAMLQGAEPVQANTLGDGWVAVPVEPTLDMVKAGAVAASSGMLIPGMYRAMLAAAPQQEVK
ncbi:TPA: hypothetical protein ACOELP_000983 [Enterobacter hormaechei]